ncbi:MAG TPA: nucleotide exchange factor GrpE [Actinobacteria bacterium]|mgnify:CR=1 FL=1|jgi:molecular chaperone GrpE|nr:nucleotide exchange factor GrpE [Actinomycetota bacterium]
MADKKVKKKSKGNGDFIKRLMEDESLSENIIVRELLEEMELLREELGKFKKSENEHMDRIKRIQADYENYRKRTLKEHIELIKRANKDLIEKLLPVIDSFNSAIDMAVSSGNEDNEFFKGLKMIHDKLIEILEKEGLKVINPVGEEFDPHICEAAVTEASDDVDDHHVISVLRKGYMLNDFVIRPAVVKVCVK